MKKHAWVFTLNNYEESEMPLRLIEVGTWTEPVLNWENANIIYLGYGKEKAKSGTPHLQGMLVFNRPVGIMSLKRLNSRAHWQPMRGSFQEAKTYCSKENYLEYLRKGKTITLCKEKVNDDHEREQIVQSESDNLQSLAKSQVNLVKRLEKLEKQNEMILHFLGKLNTKNFLYHDKFS